MLYASYKYDANDPWKGFLRSLIVVKVRLWSITFDKYLIWLLVLLDFQTYIYGFWVNLY